MSLYTLLAVATLKLVLPSTAKKCRAVRPDRVLTAVRRRRILVRCTVEMTRTVSHIKKSPVLANTLEADKLDLPSSSFESHCESVTLKKRAQLVEACVTATRLYEINVQDLQKTSLSKLVLFRKHDYLIQLFVLSSVNYQKLYFNKFFL